MHTIVGAGGAVGDALTRELVAAGQPVRRVSRHPRPMPGASETVAADATDRGALAAAVSGSDVVYLTLGLEYRATLWRELWPRIMANTIRACRQAAARLVFFDNVYMYGRVDGPMTEDTPFAPCSRKGEVRAEVARILQDEIGSGRLTAMITRAADFYGPHAAMGIPNLLVFDKLAKGRKALCLGSDSVPHAYTYVPDAARALAMLAEREDAWNRTWHLPTTGDPPTGREFIRMAAEALDVDAGYQVLRPLLLRLAGIWDADVREIREMLYQNRYPYLFDSSRFEQAFSFTPTSYADGIRETADAYRTQAG